MAIDFVHLRAHSEYSISDGLLDPAVLAQRARDRRLPAMALTDQDNCFAWVKFYDAAMNAGVKPILGCDLRLRSPYAPQPALLTLLAASDVGRVNLFRLLSRAWREGLERDGPTLRAEWLQRETTPGLIALSGPDGDIGAALLGGDASAADKALEYWRGMFDDALYLEVQRIGRPREMLYLNAVLAAASRHRLPLVATNAVCFADREDCDAHELRICISEGVELGSEQRHRRHFADQYLRSPEEMKRLFAELPESLSNTVEVARRCNIELRLGEHYLPPYPDVPEGMDENRHLRELAEAGLGRRLQEESVDADRNEEYRRRLDGELKMIAQMGFAGYFLIVMDFVNWAVRERIPVGPGRGSGAGSAVAWALRITDIDPIHYGLLFERFLNPDRVSMPDFDIDFCPESRERIIEYVSSKYGSERVAGIVTFNRMAAKAVVRDVARAQGKPYAVGDRLARLIPNTLGVTLQQARSSRDVEGDTLRAHLDGDGEAAEVWQQAVQLEGRVRNASRHPGGIVIAPRDLCEFAPLHCDEPGGAVATQFDKDDIEKIGLIKFDFLGLRTLTVIDRAVRAINDARGASDSELIDIRHIRLNDKPVYKMLSEARTTAVFQLESRGMRDLLRRLKPDRFDDIIALVALFRPGPLGENMHLDYVERRHGRKPVDYLAPALEPILKDTYGVFLYQEQVMECARALGDYSLGEADLLRRAMGKKDEKEMAAQRDKFVAGAQGNGIKVGRANQIFDLMEKFAGYGFNKSHATAYALLAYRTAWLKVHYPQWFAAAEMSTDMENTDHIKALIDENRHDGKRFEILPPDINESDYQFEVGGGGDIRYGLGAIKGLGKQAVQQMLEERRAGRFKNLFEFCLRLGSDNLNARAIEAVICAGAMDCFGVSRAALTAAAPHALATAAQQQRTEQGAVDDMFGSVADIARGSGDDDPCREFAQSTKAWSNLEALQREKKFLGLYLSGHPINDYLGALAEKYKRLKRIGDLSVGDEVIAAGLITRAQVMRRSNMRIFELDDASGCVDVIVSNDQFARHQELLKEDAIITVHGKVKASDQARSGMRLYPLKIDSVPTTIDASASIASLRVDFDLNGDFKQEIDWFRSLIGDVADVNGDDRSECVLNLRCKYRDQWAELALSDCRINADEKLLKSLINRLGRDRVQVEYR